MKDQTRKRRLIFAAGVLLSALALPLDGCLSYRQRKAENYDRWLGGMRKLRRALGVPTT